MPAIDIVVVIDDSPSMAPRQAQVLGALERAFDDTLSHLPGAFDLEMRVVSTTAGTNVVGCTPSPPACPLPLGGLLRWNPASTPSG